MSVYGSGSGRYLAGRLRELAKEAERLAVFAEGLPVGKSEIELEHDEAIREWEAQGGMKFGPPPLPRMPR